MNEQTNSLSRNFAEVMMKSISKLVIFPRTPEFPLQDSGVGLGLNQKFSYNSNS